MEITEILGTDGLNESRITINNNFKICQDAINELSGIVRIGETSNTIGDGSTAIVGGTLRLGNVVLTSEQLQQLIDSLQH